jgi:hypothetical protein
MNQGPGRPDAVSVPMVRPRPIALATQIFKSEPANCGFQQKYVFIRTYLAYFLIYNEIVNLRLGRSVIYL